MFDIEKDSLLSKREFIKRTGVSRNTLNRRLKEDPHAPKKYNTPLGEMYLTSEVNAWIRKFDVGLQSSQELKEDKSKTK